MEVFGYMINWFILIPGIIVVLSFIATYLFQFDYEIITGDVKSRKVKTLLATSFWFLLYYTFILLIDHEYYYNSNPELDKCIISTFTEQKIIVHTYLRIINLILILFMYILLFTVNYRANKKLLIKDKKNIIKQRNKKIKEFTLLSYKFEKMDEYINSDDSIIEKINYFLKNVYRNVIFYTIYSTINHVYNNLKEFLYVFFTKEMFVFVPVFFTMWYSNDINLKIILLLITSPFIFIIMFEVTNRIKSRNLVIQIINVYNNINDFKKDYKDNELLWVGNSNKHSIYSENKDLFFLFHRDNFKIEVVKKLESDYNRIKKNKQFIKDIQLEIKEIKESKEKLLMIFNDDFFIKEDEKDDE